MIELLTICAAIMTGLVMFILSGFTGRLLKQGTARKAVNVFLTGLCFAAFEVGAFGLASHVHGNANKTTRMAKQILAAVEQAERIVYKQKGVFTPSITDAGQPICRQGRN
jgi:enoyl-CoA hydratase/carnithine racemase